MSSITVTQNGAALGATMVIGARCFPTFDGETASYAWAFTEIPPTSNCVMNDATTAAPSFDPDTFGRYQGTLTDSFSNVFTFDIAAPPPFTGNMIEEIDSNAVNGKMWRLEDTIGEVGHRWCIMGQNTDNFHAGGEVELAAGVGLGSRGVVLSQRVSGSNNLTVPFARGMAGAFVFEGDSSFGFKLRFDSTPVSQAQVLGSTATAFLYDAGVSHKFRVSDGSSMGAYTIVEMGANSLGFFGETPIARPNVTGSRALGTALTNLLAALDSLGIITDSTTA